MLHGSLAGYSSRPNSASCSCRADIHPILLPLLLNLLTRTLRWALLSCAACCLPLLLLLGCILLLLLLLGTILLPLLLLLVLMRRELPGAHAAAWNAIWHSSHSTVASLFACR